ncbi:hypothetical protein L1987_25354 [Smallanthus sonchifolius]|uniref:Uncharacterized protein n=1 Tax=Smallanthus sonchifolius TaxID=185202 RepID=A0ACB9IQN6_9ASTR|nr:hypothetical protein L1987_25354 [Smallanthus sonchifolius]
MIRFLFYIFLGHHFHDQRRRAVTSETTSFIQPWNCFAMRVRWKTGSRLVASTAADDEIGDDELPSALWRY